MSDPILLNSCRENGVPFQKPMPRQLIRQSSCGDEGAHGSEPT